MFWKNQKIHKTFKKVGTFKPLYEMPPFCFEKKNLQKFQCDKKNM